jgi:hypothetical protein
MMGSKKESAKLNYFLDRGTIKLALMMLFLKAKRLPFAG